MRHLIWVSTVCLCTPFRFSWQQWVNNLDQSLFCFECQRSSLLVVKMSFASFCLHSPRQAGIMEGWFSLTLSRAIYLEYSVLTSTHNIWFEEDMRKLISELSVLLHHINIYFSACLMLWNFDASLAFLFGKKITCIHKSTKWWPSVTWLVVITVHTNLFVTLFIITWVWI